MQHTRGHVHIQVTTQYVKLTFLSKPTNPALKTSSVAIKFHYNFTLPWQKHQRITVLTYLPNQNVNLMFCMAMLTWMSPLILYLFFSHVNR